MIILLNLDVVISSNLTQSNEEYPTIEADINALEAPLQKGISVKDSAANTPKQVGCQSYCQNQGVCVLVSQSVTCQCANGYTGLQCQVARKIKMKRKICFFYLKMKIFLSRQDKVVIRILVIMVDLVLKFIRIRLIVFVHLDLSDLYVVILVKLEISIG
jgi:hypothetical protein